MPVQFSQFNRWFRKKLTVKLKIKTFRITFGLKSDKVSLNTYNFIQINCIGLVTYLASEDSAQCCIVEISCSSSINDPLVVKLTLSKLQVGHGANDVSVKGWVEVVVSVLSLIGPFFL